MVTIQIRNVGPLRDTGTIHLTRIMLLLGPQGVGKSTLMKILCFCRWIEKEVMLSPEKIAYYSRYKRFVKIMQRFHRLDDSFFSSSSEILYEGDCITIQWRGTKGKENAHIQQKAEFDRQRHNPKLSFLPAERNLASVVDNIDRSYRGNPAEDLLFNFILELTEARKPYNSKRPLPLSIDEDMSYFHSSGRDMIKAKEMNKSLSAYYASSGIQSAFPIDVMTSYLLSSIGRVPEMTADEIMRRFFSEGVPSDLREIHEGLSQLKKQYQYSSMQLYIEEPEQNLYPESQKYLLLNLLRAIYEAQERETAPSTLTITTHSPYLLSVINTQIAIGRAHKHLVGLEEGETKTRQLAALRELTGLGHYPQIEDYSAYFIGKDGRLKSLIDQEFPMVSGIELDGVSDWVDEYTNQIYDIIYGEDDEQ